MNVDKVVLKIAGVLSIVIGILCCITIFGVIVGIPLIIGGSKINKISLLEDYQINEQRDSILIWGIVFIFLNFISGVLCIVYYISLIQDKTEKPKTDKYSRLEQLKKLYDDKVLTKEEYENEKQKILSE